MLQPIRYYHPAVTQILNLVEQLQHWQSASTSAISAAQQQQLMAVLVHAHRYSPAWRQRLEQAAFSPSGNAVDTLSRLPLLSRDALQVAAAQFRAHWPDMPTRALKKISAVISHFTQPSPGLRLSGINATLIVVLQFSAQA